MVAARKYTELGFQRYIESLKYPPNPFQLDVLKSIAFGEGNILVSALAGSGKTTLLMQCAELLKRMAVKGSDVLFLAFNVKIAEEMSERLPAGFTAINSHKFGNQVLNIARPGTKFDQSWKKWRDIIDPLVKLHGFERDSYRARKMLENLCSKAMLSNVKLIDLTPDEKIQAIADIKRVAAHFSIGGKDGGEDEEADDEEKVKMMEALIPLVPQVVQKAKEVWEITGLVNFDEMLYLPVALNLPIPQFEYCFIDECQDLNSLQQQLAIRACRPDGRMVFVGDRMQCVTEGTLIDNQEVSTIKAWDTVFAARGRERKLKQVVLETQSEFIENQPTITITTRTGKQLTTTFHHMHFADYLTSHGEIYPYYVYLMYKNSIGYRVGVSRKYQADTSKLPIGYMQRLNHEQADAAWVLHACDSESEARFYEALYAARYQLPTVTFRARPHGVQIGNSLIGDQALINRLFKEVDTHTGADQLLADFGMLHDYPHHIPKAVVNSRRRNVSVIFCGDARAGTVLHQLELSGNDDADAECLRAAGFNITDNGKGTGWRCRQYTIDAAELHDWTLKIQQVLPVNVIRKANFGGKALKFMPASHIRKGMMMYVENEHGQIVLDEVVDVQVGQYTGNVYELNVAKLHNYIANGIVTHNSIYGFAGADAEAFDNIKHLINGTVLPLNICYRCPPEHLDLARAIVPEIEAAPNAKSGTIDYITKREDFIKAAGRGTLIMNRITAPLVELYFELLEYYAIKPKEERITVKMLGKDVAAMLGGIIDKVAKMPAFRYENIIEFLDQYESLQRTFLIQREASESQLMQLSDSVRILQICVENFTDCHELACLKRELKDLFGDEKDKGYNQADCITLLTVHRAKGLEAEHTMILQPDKMPLAWKGQQMWEFLQEMKILYVALTRSMKRLTVFGELGSLRVNATPDETNARRKNDFEKIEVKADVTDGLPPVKIEEEKIDWSKNRISKAEAFELAVLLREGALGDETKDEVEVVVNLPEEALAYLSPMLPTLDLTVATTAQADALQDAPTVDDVVVIPEPVVKPANVIELPAINLNLGSLPIVETALVEQPASHLEPEVIAEAEEPAPTLEPGILPEGEFVGSADREIIAEFRDKLKDMKSNGGLFGDIEDEPAAPTTHSEPKDPADHVVPSAPIVTSDEKQPEPVAVDTPIDDAKNTELPFKATGNLKADLDAIKKRDSNKPDKAAPVNTVSSHKRGNLVDALERITDPKVCDTLIELLMARKADLESIN